MDQDLADALMLTLTGMGMTFISIGVLTLGMYLMRALTNRKRQLPSDGPLDQGPVAGEPVDVEVPADVAVDHHAAAAAAAVAVQRAVAAQAAAAAIAVAEATRRQLPERSADFAQCPPEQAWNTYVRGRHLSLRSRYEARRARG
jgi:Na+-transporting methylmalonyl-CoA/oxaloacetate decarboxylase gamma subunit